VKRVAIVAAVSAFAAASTGLSSSGAQGGATQPYQQDACTFLSTPAATPDETAWRLFVAANCAGKKGGFAWEDWIEQEDLYPSVVGPSGVSPAKRTAVHRVHASQFGVMADIARLRSAGKNAAAVLKAASQGCRQINDFKGALPPNVVDGGEICEETRINPVASAFITGQGYQWRTGQAAAAASGLQRIEFPPASIELKVMWLPAASLKSSFKCDGSNPELHTEELTDESGKKTCYAMAGMHLIAKLYQKWLWATFEVKDMRTNPLRCVWFGPCRDSWGAVPAESYGGSGDNTQLTAQLADLMNSAGLPQAFRNFRLVGTQVDYGTSEEPTLNGNSVIEGEGVGMDQNESSCITCHSFSTVSAMGDEDTSDLDHPGPVGPYVPHHPDWLNRGFVWSLFLACPDPPGTKPEDRRCHWYIHDSK